MVSVGFCESRLDKQLLAQLPGYATIVLLALALGAGGSMLLASRLKRQTFGLEPYEIAGLLEEREASLQGIHEGAIATEQPFDLDQVQPASLDLRLGATAYRVRASFLPGPGQTVAERVADLKLHEIDLRQGAVLERGCVYIVPLLESLSLPPTVAAATNPKSSTGRLDIFTRVIADGARSFDTVAAGYRGPLH